MSYESSVQQLEATNAQLVKEVVRSRDLVAAMGNLYPSISEGRAAVANGQYFAVPGGANVYATLYRKTGATTQDTIAEYPSRDSLATAAFANVATLQQALDGTAGVLPDAAGVHASFNQYGLGQNRDLRGTIYTTNTPSDLLGVGVAFGFCGGGSLGIPGFSVNQYGSVEVGCQWIDVSGISSAYRRFVRGSGGSTREFLQTAIDASTWGVWKETIHTGNTTVDSNGFIKQASPIINLFDDQLTGNAADGVTLTKGGTGVYTLNGVEPLAESGWYIETPKDRNGNIYFTLDYEQDLTARTLTIRTYEPDYSTGPATNGTPVDINPGRFVALRFNEKPEEPELPEPGEPTPTP